MTEVELRSYNHETDYAGLRTLLEEAGLFDSDYETPDRLEAASHKFPGMITVAVIGSAVVGSVYFQDGVIPTINRLAVRREYQKQGIGTKLLETAESRARELGHKYLELYVLPESENACTFYENRGYTLGHTYLNMYRQIEN